MKKILLAIQFWERDKEQAMKVARLIADLQPGFCDIADFMFVARFDCEQDMKTIEHVSRKFNVHHFINSRFRGAEWPHGCNSLWFGTMDYIFSMTEAKRIPDYKAVLTFEADSSPLSPNWISELSQAWDKANVKVLGAMQTNPAPHVNGNALFSCDLPFLKWIARDIAGCTPHAGWDFVLANAFKKKGWADCPAMRSWWGYPTMSKETFDQLGREGVVFFHGCKDDSMVRHVRERFVP